MEGRTDCVSLCKHHTCNLIKSNSEYYFEIDQAPPVISLFPEHVLGIKR